MSALTLRLAEEGLIELDDPIAEHLPSFPAADRITIRQLLGHRAGIHDPTPELVSDRDGPPDPEKVFTPQELLDASAAGTPTFDSTLPDVEVVNAYTDLDLDGEPDPMGKRPLQGLVTPAWTAGASSPR
jgi:CubicO group peptidase (beta-lactamase class C family)